MKFFRILMILGGLAACMAGRLHAEVEINVKGVGWRDDRSIERLLKDVLGTSDGLVPSLDTTMVEDALLVLRGELIRQGFLSPEIRYVLYDQENIIDEGSWDFTTNIRSNDWPSADRIVFEVDRGDRSHVKSVEFHGLESIPENEAREFFLPSGGLFVSEAERAYSPSKLESGMRLLRLRLGQLGFLKAEVTVKEMPDVATGGEVNLSINVVEGPLHVWGTTKLVGAPAEEIVDSVEAPSSGQMFSMEVLQDWISAVRTSYLVAGYPDVSVSADQKVTQKGSGNEVAADIELTINPGPRVRLGEIIFDGLQKTNANFLRMQTQLEPGSWLDRTDVQAARFRLGQLGIFRRVQTEYVEKSANIEDPQRDVRFIVHERERKSLSLLFGYGSYEQVRIGAEARVLNLFGRAHSAHVRLRQSLKSSAGSLYYTVPRPVSWLTSGQLRLQGLLREEISFDREEALFAAGTERNFFDGLIHTTLEYRYELLQAKGFESAVVAGDNNTSAGSLNFGFSWDTRDQIVRPRKGASVHAVLELASRVIGSESEFQRLLLRSSYHRPLKDDWLRCHFGLEGGVLSRLGSLQSELPTNKRFFPGGENSIRGYKEGEASPRDEEGIAIGAEAYALVHAELEASILDALAVVLFYDGLWSTPYLDQGSQGEMLSSLGLGIRYSTPFGPLRLEYGHNLDPRPYDPDGTLHVSIGFPF